MFASKHSGAEGFGTPATLTPDEGRSGGPISLHNVVSLYHQPDGPYTRFRRTQRHAAEPVASEARQGAWLLRGERRRPRGLSPRPGRRLRRWLLRLLRAPGPEGPPDGGGGVQGHRRPPRGRGLPA